MMEGGLAAEREERRWDGVIQSPQVPMIRRNRFRDDETSDLIYSLSLPPLPSSLRPGSIHRRMAPSWEDPSCSRGNATTRRNARGNDHSIQSSEPESQRATTSQEQRVNGVSTSFADYRPSALRSRAREKEGERKREDAASDYHRCRERRC